MKRYLKDLFRTVAIGFPVMVFVQAGFKFAGFGSDKGWTEIVILASAWAILYSLATHTYEALKA